MRIYAKRFLAVFGAVMLTLVAVLTAACDGKKNKQPEAAVYTVTVEYDETKGIVTFSKTSAEEGELVTVFVEAKEGFEIDEVTVNSAEVTLTEGEYTFAITQDTVVKATFEEELKIPEEISVTVVLSNYAKARGTVTVTGASDDIYHAGEEITVTVTPNTGYDVGSVTVNGDSVKLTDGAYTFVPEEDITVKATFHLAAADLPVVSGLPAASSSFGAAFRGSWMSVDGETPIYIGTNKLCVGDNAISSVTPSGAGGEQTYLFKIDGTTYSLSWLHSAYSQRYVLHLLNHNDDTSEYFVKDPLPVVRIAEHFKGYWVVEYGDTKLAIEGNNINYDGKDADVIVDLGYYETAEDGLNSPINSNLYYFFVEGNAYLLGWYPVGKNPTVNTRSFIQDVERMYHFAEEFQGTWVSLDGETKIIIGETALTINNTRYPVDGYGEHIFILEWQGLKYEVTILNESDHVLQLTHYTYDDSNRINGVSFVYFVSTRLPTITVDSLMFGEWKFAKGSSSSGGSISSADMITINGNDIRWGSDRAVVISGETRPDGFTYVIAVRNMICILSYLSRPAGDDEETLLWTFTLETTDGRYEFVNNAHV